MNKTIRYSIEEIWNSNFPNWVSVKQQISHLLPGDFGYGDTAEGSRPQWERDNDAVAAAQADPKPFFNIHPIGGGGVRGLERIIKLPKICFRAAGGAVPRVPALIPEVRKVPKTDTDPKTDPDNRGDEPSNKHNESPSDEHDAHPPSPEFRPPSPTPRPAAE